MPIWSAEIKELETLNASINSRFPELEKDLEHLIKTDDENVALLYSRRCLEIIVTDLCESELKRPRKTEPLKGIIDKLHHEEKVPSHIITSMHSLNSMSTFGTHPKEFDPRQVRSVLINLTTILRWYLKYHNIIFPEVIEEEELEKGPEAKKHNLRIPTTSFIGREKEMKEVKDLFHHSRLVTLTGAGGCGKTRLAGEIALTLTEEYKDGVWFIDLAPVIDPGFVDKKIAEALNVKEDPSKTIIATIIENIKNKSLLVLLDNCEHLIQQCAEIADRLLQSVEGIRLLATSREPLNIPGEVVWRIPSLSFPEPDSKKDIIEFQRYDAIKLFTDRATSGKPGFTLNPQNVSPVVGICQRVAGIPLAIELAATRIRHIGPEAILERLEDQFKILTSSGRTTPERQQTLKATIDWSYNLLSEQEKLLFNRLSVFAGDFSLEAAEEVCTDNKFKKENILPVLSQLVDKSLVIAESQEDGSVRYRWLVPLQQYSFRNLIESREEEKQRKQHLSYYLKIAEQAYEEQFESQPKWLSKLELEGDNLNAALSWSEKYASDTFIRLSGALAWYWRMHSLINLGKNYLEKALSKVVDKNETSARVLLGLAFILRYSKDFSHSRNIDLMMESLSIWRQFKNLRDEAWVLSEISEEYDMSGDFETSMKYSEQSLEIARKVGDPGLINHCLAMICQVYVHSKQYDRGRPLVEELLSSSEKLGHIYGIECAKHFLGDCAQGTMNFKEAERLYARGIETGLKYGWIWLAACDMQGVAFALSGQSRWAKSIRLDTAAREKIKTIGGSLDGLVPFWDEWIETYLKGARIELGEELTRKYEEEGRNMGFEAAIEHALDFEKD
jgi:predicted ATPase